MARDKALSEKIIAEAKAFGACAAGIADVEALKASPSHVTYGKIGTDRTIGNTNGDNAPGTVSWPEAARSVIVVAVEHAETDAQLDWWTEGQNGGTPGNRKLMDITDNLAVWLEKEHAIDSTRLSYHVENGGVLLKDAAVLAGLGCLGKNNMLVTPVFGPRVRLRGILTHETIASSKPLDFDPCEDCEMPCQQGCPQNAFRSKIYYEKDLATGQLPARDGVFSRRLCNKQMMLDVKKGEEAKRKDPDSPTGVVKYCRRCEFSCPVGLSAG